jgi:hypothetical protein
MSHRWHRSPQLLRGALLVQAAYFIGSGLWANLHRRSFEAVAGPKCDYWLTRVVGALVIVIGGTLAAGGCRRRPPDEVVGLAASSAMALGAIETYYAAKRRISLMYILDACIEALLVASLVIGWRRSRSEEARS